MENLSSRASGVLMHISSLPGNTGIGTLGQAAYEFVDFLKKADQTYWQILPVCPTSFGDSPYQSFSTFAGNPYFIDIDMLCEEGFIHEDEYSGIQWGGDKTRVDYALLYIKRHEVFKKVQKHFKETVPADFEKFCMDNAFWLDDYALFMAIKDSHGGVSFDGWDDTIRRRGHEAVKMWRDKCSERVQYYKMLQYFFFKQWFKLKTYANRNGIKIIGDLPIYVSRDSSDVWASPRQFFLDNDYRPIEVAGCPPDAFSADGQLWGNPVYNWRYMKKTRYRWWIQRLKMSLKIYDVIRIDHFRGFDSYYCIKNGSKTAKEGVWRKGPGIHFWKSMNKHLGDLPIIAEDLGFLTDSVRKLLSESNFPGLKVLQFAFDSREESDYLPYRYPHNCVVYTGTHDNDTILGWAETAAKKDVDFAMKYLCAKNKDDLRVKMMLTALSSVADTCILTMQDLIGLGSKARMNIPSTVGGNWCWRAMNEQITPQIGQSLAYYTRLYGRAHALPANTEDTEDNNADE